MLVIFSNVINLNGMDRKARSEDLIKVFLGIFNACEWISASVFAPFT